MGNVNQTSPKSLGNVRLRNIGGIQEHHSHMWGVSIKVLYKNEIFTAQT